MQRASKESGLNLSIFAFNVVFVVPCIAILSTGLYEFVQASGIPTFGASIWSSTNSVIVVFVAVFIGDFVGYWRHRLEHTALLWPAHAVHHSDTEMTWLTLERFHPINRITTFVIDNAALLALGFPPYAIVAKSLVRHYYGYLIHADLPWTYDRFAYVFVSPAMHRWHHAADPRAFYTNFATVFSVFDRFFGTYRVPGLCTVPLGVTDEMSQSLAGQLAYAFSPRAYTRLFTSRRNTDEPTEPKSQIRNES
ncbi:MAG: sterol desaturase family protein [Boseongicola sp.]